MYVLGHRKDLLFLILSTLIPLCNGCARTSDVVVTTTTSTPLCTTFGDTSPLTIDDGTTLQNANINVDPVAQCTDCTSGTRQFYPETNQAVPSDVIGNAQVSEGVQCTNPAMFCTCNSAGVCCTPGAIPPDTVLFIPFNGVQDVIVQSPDGATLTCTDGSTFSDVGITNDAPVGDAVYFKADSVSCSGCTNIQNNQCQLPVIEL